MRELKFRAWLPKDEIMLFSDHDVNDDYMEVWGFDGNGIVLQIQELKWREGGGEVYEEIRYVNAKSEIMQFTGLQDKNGVDIYEGDILKLVSLDPGYPLSDELHEVKYDPYGNGYPAFDLVPGDLQDECNNLQLVIQGDYTCEIVGNIYQNQELPTAVTPTK